MADTHAIDCSKPQPLVEKFDAEAVTKQLEGGHTAMLEAALGKAQSVSERTDMLKVVQGINAAHRLEQPDKHLPALSVDVEPVGNWARPSLQVSLKRQEYKNFAVPELIYVEKNSGFGAHQTREVVKPKH
ncbi:MAG: hypothetical protein WC028_21185 [Candidatus Obscuribacterales bacterium]|jgi:hypothetical protein